MSKTSKYTIQETIKLPSRGLIYKGIPESFSMRPMSVSELSMLYGGSNTMNALDDILASVISEENFPIEDLISADKVYLAYMLRAITFGEEYKAKVYCPKCKKTKDVSFSLIEDIKVNYLEDNFENPRNIGKLPICGDEVTLKLLTTKDITRVFNRAQEIREQFDDYKGEPIYPLMIASQIATVNGKKKQSRELEDYVMDLHAVDNLYIDKKISEVKVGPVTPVEVECPTCGGTLEVTVNIAEDFFRPQLEF